MEITVVLPPQVAETLMTLAEYCGVSATQLAETFISDSSRSFILEQNELRDSLSKP